MVNDPNKHPGRFYYRGQQFIILAVPETPFTRSELVEQYGEAEENLASRAGKLYRQYVYAKQGFAFSSSHKTDDVLLLEIFHPCTLEEYERNFYIPAGNFIK
jgi:hypothetical protein